jgi:hypothetical protein
LFQTTVLIKFVRYVVEQQCCYATTEFSFRQSEQEKKKIYVSTLR